MERDLSVGQFPFEKFSLRVVSLYEVPLYTYLLIDTEFKPKMIPDTGADICAAPHKILAKWPTLKKTTPNQKFRVAGYCNVKLSLESFSYQANLTELMK